MIYAHFKNDLLLDCQVPKLFLIARDEILLYV